MGKISIDDVTSTITGPWQPRDLAVANDAIVRIARFHGEFPWHHHDEDELFLCWEGTFRLELKDREPITLRRGDIFVVPRGVDHRPVAEEPAYGLMIERPDTKQYGN
ncbi:cupin domain-containing protein [Nocardia terpenica]|uniref:Cupin n=1 Tax=Nocardia terpenica TaxID=455432 RepID=A0A161XAZ7_9NOCA|nr:cupin domain-containing protein [Nocardia terpenica]KZM70318.1 cupin [Nocardia terpenica]MBF6063909.1 cupin domain-containing protein [Nocardia terpenica]MBF6107855.1 cupin domain-containing protein [Nocardia terpenica]MBF6114923.1 cupin domain-containing protein [Nocardia terpenica]MBF6121090.1 cupin domain-containing protein [Nocardia terpenica]